MSHLAIFETHPVQYHAPVWRELAAMGIPLTVFYGGDFSVKGYLDREFGTTFSWDVDLLEGYQSEYLFKDNGPKDYDEVSGQGVRNIVQNPKYTSVLTLGYSHRFDRRVIFESLLARKPLLMRAEMNDSANERSKLQILIRDSILKVLYRKCDALFYIGTEAKNHFERLGVPEAKLHHSPYCVSVDNFSIGDNPADVRAQTRKKLEIPLDSPVVVYCGKLSRRKGVDLLADAALSASSKPFVLYVGDGELRAELEKLPGAESRFRFVGFQNQKALSEFYYAADCFVLPSKHSETWGLVTNEALHHGLPVCVSDSVGCAKDLVLEGVTGYRFASGDYESLIDSLEATLSLSLQPETRSLCLAHGERFTVSKAAEGLAEAISR